MPFRLWPAILHSLAHASALSPFFTPGRAPCSSIRTSTCSSPQEVSLPTIHPGLILNIRAFSFPTPLSRLSSAPNSAPVKKRQGCFASFRPASGRFAGSFIPNTPVGATSYSTILAATFSASPLPTAVWNRSTTALFVSGIAITGVSTFATFSFPPPNSFTPFYSTFCPRALPRSATTASLVRPATLDSIASATCSLHLRSPRRPLSSRLLKNPPPPNHNPVVARIVTTAFSSCWKPCNHNGVVLHETFQLPFPSCFPCAPTILVDTAVVCLLLGLPSHFHAYPARRFRPLPSPLADHSQSRRTHAKNTTRCRTCVLTETHRFSIF